METNAVFGPAHVVVTSDPLDAHTNEQFSSCLGTLTTCGLTPGAVHIVLNVTSSATGSTVLQTCEFDLTLLGPPVCPTNIIVPNDQGQCSAVVNYTVPAGASALVPGLGMTSSGRTNIENIQLFLDTCPVSDPALTTIRNDFLIRRNGVLVGDIPCSEPVSQLSLSQYTDELILLQTLRTIYYMDQGKSGHLPWTQGTLYNWMKSKIQGINIIDNSGSFCCQQFDGKNYIAIGAKNDLTRDFDHKWEGISANIDLIAHETRHVDGFPHTSCCGIFNGCDQTYDESNLSPYGVQWWLNKSWLMGDINVGAGCLSPSRIQEIADWHLGAANSTFRSRFCVNPPPLLSLPQFPEGQCPAMTSTVACVPPPGTAFPVGTTVVTCTSSVTGSACPNSCTFTVTVLDTSTNCPLTRGFWENHPASWPVSTLALGTVTYTEAQLLSILASSPVSPSGVDASLILADQLIAAKLNLANGSDPCPIGSIIAAADALIDSHSIPIVPKITPGSTVGKQMVALALALDSYNKGMQTPNCAEGQDNSQGGQSNSQ
jgi:hypothetical protein